MQPGGEAGHQLARATEATGREIKVPPRTALTSPGQLGLARGELIGATATAPKNRDHPERLWAGWIRGAGKSSPGSKLTVISEGPARGIRVRLAFCDQGQSRGSSPKTRPWIW